jgi:hypothetical protein
MKQIYLLLTTLLLVHVQVFGQSVSSGVPNKFTYQSVVRDTSGQLVTNQAVGMRLSLQRGPQMTNLYTETHQLTTNSNGLLTTTIGSGQPTLGMMDTIDWSGGMVYVKTEIDMSGGSNYSLASTRELLSVPYALYSLNSGSSTPGPVGPMGPQGPAGNDGAVGPQGPQGVPGNDGAVGPQGPQGVPGNDGAVGPQGPIGLTGPAGPQGAPGNDGAVGPQGPIGLTGPAGSNGAVGPQGPIGLTGPAGPQGPIGLTGPQGVPGNDGPQGIPGPRGINGVTGNGSNGFYTSTSTGYWIVPIDVSQINVLFKGSIGGSGGNSNTMHGIMNGAAGGSYAFISIVTSVTAGDTVWFNIGNNGVNGAHNYAPYTGGINFYVRGGDGTTGGTSSLTVASRLIFTLTGGEGGTSGYQINSINVYGVPGQNGQIILNDYLSDGVLYYTREEFFNIAPASVLIRY